jgi:hypothetical protein
MSHYALYMIEIILKTFKQVYFRCITEKITFDFTLWPYERAHKVLFLPNSHFSHINSPQ